MLKRAVLFFKGDGHRQHGGGAEKNGHRHHAGKHLWNAGRQVNISDPETNRFTCEAMFATLTNVEFDPYRLEDLLRHSMVLRDNMVQQVHAAGGKITAPGDALTLKLKPTIEGLVKQGGEHGLMSDPDVNSLPLSFILSWYEQKAVAILLSLLHLGIQDIHLGPSLPVFITPNVLNVLVKNYNIKPISTPEQDLKQILG